MLNLIGRRARRFTLATQYHVAARRVSSAAWDVVDAIESAADIQMEVERHRRLWRGTIRPS